MDELLITAGTITVATGIIVEMLKRARINIDSKMLPVISLIVGALGNVAVAVWMSGLDVNYYQLLIVGASAGATASSGYDVLKLGSNFVKKK